LQKEPLKMLILNGGEIGDLKLFDSSRLDASADQTASGAYADVFAVDRVPASYPYPVEDPENLFSATVVPEPVAGTPMIQSTQNGGIGGALSDIWGNIKDAVGGIAESTVAGAVEGASASTGGAATGAEIGGSVTRIGTTTLLFGGLVLLLLLRR
jgi:hypothetical protein